jgi:hypothetical protein
MEKYSRLEIKIPNLGVGSFCPPHIFETIRATKNLFTPQSSERNSMEKTTYKSD